MRHIRLKTIHDDDSGTLGFVLADMPNFDGLVADNTGLLTAHDILEHQNGIKNMGPVWDEMEAVGAIIFVRADNDYRLSQHHSVANNLSSDIVRMYYQYENEQYDRPYNKNIGTKKLYPEYEEIIQETIEIARKYILEEYEDVNEETLNNMMNMAEKRMRTGFRKAKKRFKTSMNAYNMFTNIEIAVKYAANEIEYEGQEFILSYDRYNAKVKMVEDYSDY